MDETINVLKIEIVGNDSKATENLDSLITSIENLKKASRSTKGLTNLGKALASMSEAIDKLEDSAVNKLTKIAESLRKLEVVKDIKITPSFNKNIKELAGSMAEFNKLDPSQLSNIGTAFSGLGSIKGLRIPKNLASSVIELADAADRASSVDYTGVRNMSDAYSQLGNLKGLKLPKLPAAGDATAGKTEFPDIVHESTQSGSIFDLASLAGITGTASKSATVLSGALKGIGTGAMIGGAAAIKAITAVGKGIGAVKNTVTSIVGKGATAIGKGLTLPFRRLGEQVGNSVSKMGQFFRSIKRIAMYRAIRTMLNSIVTGLKTGTDNLYQWSLIMDRTFARSMDSAATSMQYFRNSVGAAVAPLINALAPALEFIIDKVVTLINQFNQLMARLTGASTWTKAIRSHKSYADAATNTATATKEAKKAQDAFTASILGMDELNVMQDNSVADMGGDGGSSPLGSGVPDYASMFETVSLDKSKFSFIDDLKALIKAGDWDGAGRLLGSKVNSLVDRIDFSAVGTKLGTGMNNAVSFLYGVIDEINFVNIGAGIATGLNSALNEIDAVKLGGLLAKKITTAIDTAYGFVITFDWAKFGTKIGDFINGWVSEFDPARMAGTLQGFVMGMFSTIQNAVATTNWTEIGTKVATLINELDFKEILGGLGTTISSVVSGLLEFAVAFTSELDWDELSTEIWEGLGAMLANIDWEGILSKASTVLGNLAGGIIGLIWDGLQLAWEDTKAYFDGYIEEAGGNVFLGILTGIWEGVKGIGTWIKENIFTPFIDGFKSAFGINSPSEETKPLGKFIIDGIWEGIKSAWTSITDFFGEKLEALKTTISEKWDDVKTKAGEKWDSIKTTLGNKWDDIKTNASTKFDDVKNRVSSTWDDVKSTAGSKWDSIKSNLGSKWDDIKGAANNRFNDIKDATGGTWDDLKSNTSSTWDSIKTNLSGKWDDIKGNASNKFEDIRGDIGTTWSFLKGDTDLSWGDIQGSLLGKWEDIKGNASSKFGDIKTSIVGIWDSIWNSLKGTINSIIGGFESMVNGVVGGLNGMIRALNRLKFDVPDWVPLLGGKRFGFSLNTINTVSIPRLKDGGEVPDGQMFIAREAGPELVAQAKGGGATVMNNDQILQSIEGGVERANSGVISVLVRQNELLRQLLDKETVVEAHLSTSEITRGLDRKNRRDGKTTVPVST